MCVAPKDFAQDVELIQMRDVPELFSAMGKKLRVYGERLVPFLVQTADGRSLRIVVRFVIADVRRPLLSVSALTDQGFDVSFGINSTITKPDSGSVVEMVRRGNAYFLPATVTNGMSKMVHGEVNAAMSPENSGPMARHPAGGFLQSDERDAVMLD